MFTSGELHGARRRLRSSRGNDGAAVLGRLKGHVGGARHAEDGKAVLRARVGEMYQG